MFRVSAPRALADTEKQISMMSACANLKLFILDILPEWSCVSENYYVHSLYKKDTERYVYSFIYLSKLAFRILLAFSKTFFYIKNTIHGEMFL